MPAQSANSRDHNDPLIHFVDLCINLSLLVVILSLLSINSQIVDKRKLARSSQQSATAQIRPVDGSASLTTVKGETDSDGDGFSDSRETYLGTDPTRACGINAWPPDINNDGKVDSSDLDVLKQYFFKPVTADTKRYDLNMSGKIDIFDVNLFSPYFDKKCTDLFPPQVQADTLKIDLGNGVDPPPAGTVGQVYPVNLPIHVFSQKLNRWLNSNETTLTYTGSLPPGLALNDILDFISGTPTAIGRYDFTIKAFSQPTNVSATKAASITVNPAPLPCSGTPAPSINGQAKGQVSVEQNKQVTFAAGGFANCKNTDKVEFKTAINSPTFNTLLASCSLDNGTSCSVSYTASLNPGVYSILAVLVGDGWSTPNVLFLNVTSPPPSVPTLNSPNISCAGGKPVVNFSWSVSQNANNYYMIISNNSRNVGNVTSFEWNQNSPVSNSAGELRPENNTTYSSRVDAYNLTGGVNSNVVNFTTGDCAPPPPSPPPPSPSPSPILFDRSFDDIKNYIKKRGDEVGNYKIPPTLVGVGETYNIGYILWGLSGCETGATWNPDAVGDHGSAIGLFQFHLATFLGTPQGQANGDARRNPYLSTDATIWKFTSGGDPYAWTCMKYNSYGNWWNQERFLKGW